MSARWRRKSTKRKTWKWFGGHERGTYRGEGSYYKKQYWRAERRFWKNFINKYIDDPEIQPRITDHSLKNWRSWCNWQGH